MAGYERDQNKIQTQFEYNDKEHERIDLQNTKQHDEIKIRLDELYKVIIGQEKDYVAFKNRMTAYGTIAMLSLSASFGWLFKKLFN